MRITYDDYLKGWKEATGAGYSSWYPFRRLIKKVVFKGNDYSANRLNISSVTFENWAVPTFREPSYLDDSSDSIGIHGIIERSFQGYTFTDLTSINGWFLEQMPRMLRNFKRDLCSYPGNMTFEEWGTIIERMAFCFSEMHPLLSDVTMCIEEERIAYKKIKKEAFGLFLKYFEHLWW